MNKNKFFIVLLVVLVIITAGVAVWHNTTRVTASEGALRIECGETTVELPLSELPLRAVTGSVINGKGEQRVVDGQGVLLAGVLEKAGVSQYTQVEAVADDSYSAVVTREEIAQPDKAFLLLDKDGQAQLVVFGDENSKRNVTGLIRLIVT